MVAIEVENGRAVVPVAAEPDGEVVAEPAGQGHVPAPPELVMVRARYGGGASAAEPMARATPMAMSE